MRKYIAALLSAVFLLVCCTVPVSAAEAQIKIVIDGRTVSSDVAPLIKDSRTLVPVRVITEHMGALVSWNGTTRKVTIEFTTKTLTFTIGSKTVYVNGVAKMMDTTAEIINNRTIVPLSFISGIIGADAVWNATDRIVSVYNFTKFEGTIKTGGSTTVQPITQAAADVLNIRYPSLSISVAGGGSGAGVTGAIDGTFNLGAISRDLSASEISKTPDLKAYRIAYDGIAIIVHKDNQCKNLTKEQARKIFLGDITNWADVGGKNAPILVQTRETGSGTLDAMKELLLEKKSVVATATPHASTGLLKHAVAAEPNAIGFISGGYVDATVNTVSIDNINPTPMAIKEGTYPIGRSLWLVSKGTPIGASAMFIDWLRTNEGQALVVKDGYVSIR